MSLHTFNACAPQADQVHLAGSFNEWDATASPMERTATGDWSLSLDLEPGNHEFKFVVDGAWCCEPGCDGPHAECPGCVPNDMGTMNRVVEIPHAPQKKRLPTTRSRRQSQASGESASGGAE